MNNDVIWYPKIVPKGAPNRRKDVTIGRSFGGNHLTDTFVGACMEQARPKAAINVPILTTAKL